MSRSFNGGGQYIAAGFNTSVPLSVSFWYFAEDTTNQQTLFFIGDNAGTVGFYGNYRASTVNKPWGIIQLATGGTSGEAQVVPGISAAGWHHMGAVYASSSSRSAYLDAVKGTNIASVSGPTVQKLEIGRFGSGASYTTGRIAEFAAYNVALSDDDMTALARGVSPLSVRPSALVFYSPLVRDLRELQGASPMTDTTSTTVSDHPRIYR